MGELASLVKMRITSTHLIQYPSGRWGFVGRVPIVLAYENPTPEQLENRKFGARFGPETRSFETKQDAIDFANANDCNI